MAFSLFNSVVWQMIAKADMMGKFILAGLFVHSVVSIALIVFKAVSFYTFRKNLLNVLARMKQCKSINDVITLSRDTRDTLGGRLLASHLSDLKQQLEGVQSKEAQVNMSTEHTVILTTQKIELLADATNQTIDSMIVHDLEPYLSVLNTSAMVAPLIGLFGTIWGLIHAFIDISREKTADIATVAPGMAEALIATMGGLIVAIPAMIAFHYFTHQVRRCDFYLGQITDRFLSLVTQIFLR